MTAHLKSIHLQHVDQRRLCNAVSRIHARIDSAVQLINMEGSWLDEMQAAADKGLWLHPETTEARQLASDVTTLQLLASALLELRAKLVANMPKDKADAV